MAKYILDANIFIQAKNGPYDMEVAPVFWNWLDAEFNKGTIISSSLVSGELKNGNDDLAEWVKERNSIDVFPEPTERAQAIFSEISDYVNRKYEPAFVEKFLDGADPWVIAQAKDLNIKVVTNEKRVNSNAKKIKIPNIGDVFDVKSLNMYELLKVLGARFN